MNKILDLFTLRQGAEDTAADLPALMQSAQTIANGLVHGDHARRKPGSGEKFWQFREYIDGDRPQDIDWRQSAKTDRIYTREKERQTAQKCFFWCADDPGMDFSGNPKRQTKLEAARILSLALAILLARGGDAVGALGSQKTGSSEAAIQRLGETLITGQNKSLPTPGDVKTPSHSTIILIGDFLSPIEDIRQSLSPLSKQTQNVLLLQIMDPAEIELPFNGNAVFETRQKTNIEAIPHIGSIRSEYQTRIRDHNTKLESIVTRYGWKYAFHRTDKLLKDTLGNLWHLMDRRAF